VQKKVEALELNSRHKILFSLAFFFDQFILINPWTAGSLLPIFRFSDFQIFVFSLGNCTPSSLSFFLSLSLLFCA